MRGLSLVVASGGLSSSRCTGLSLSQPLLLWSTGSRCAGSVIVAHGPSCSVACGIFPDQGSNPCPLHWQADSQPLRHQGSPLIFNVIFHIMHFYLLKMEFPHLPVVGWIVSPKEIWWSPNPWYLCMTLFGNKSLWRCNQFSMSSLGWAIIQYDWCHYKKKCKDRERHRGRMPCYDRGKDRNDAAISQGIPRIHHDYH